MSAGGKRDREELALDALLVSALRLADKDEDTIDPDRLPQLTEAEKAATEGLGKDFIARLLAGERPLRSSAPPNDGGGRYVQEELALSYSGADYALNRAEEIDGDTAEELERRKREILERKAHEREAGGAGA
jgi:hypothetical protein